MKKGRNKLLLGLKNRIRRSGILYKILLPYTTFIIMILVVFSLLVEMLITYHTKTEIQNSTDQILEQAYNTSDLLLEHNFSYYFDLYYSDSQMREYLYSSAMDPNNYTEVINYLLNCAGRDVITHSIYLYNEQLGIIFSSNEGAFDIKDFYDQEMVRYINDRQEESKFIPREMKWKIGAAQKKSNVISYIFYNESSVTGDRMALVVNIDQQKYQNLIGKNLEKSSVITEVISPNGTLMSGVKGSIGQSLKDEYFKEILASDKEKDSFEYQDAENSYYISWRCSSLFGWVYVGKANYNDLLSNFIQYNRIIISCAAFFVVLGLLLSIFFMRKIYLPIKDLVRNIELDGMERGAYRNEYEFLNAAMEGFEINANEMKVTQYRYNQVKKNEMICKLLYGDKFLEMDYTEAMKKIGLLLQGPVFCVTRFSFNQFESIKATNSKTDIDIFSFAIINILEEYLGNRGYGAYGLRDGEGAFCFILQLEEEYEKGPDYNTRSFQNENVTGIQKILFAAKSELERLLKYFTFTVSVGRSVRNYEDLHRSYLDTKYADVYRLVRGTQQIILFTEHMENYESRMAYPLNEEKKLISYIKLLKEDMILTSIEEFFEAIQKMSPNETRWSINQLMVSVLHMIMTLNYKMKDGSPVDWKEWTNQINATDTREEMKEVLIHLLENLSGEQDSGSGAKSRIANKIKQYVDEHYREDTLSVTEIASYTGFSTNYVRLIFKNEFGDSISDYIQNKRIEKAKELLRTSNYTSKEIAGMVGYTDNRYFYVVFKRIVGETADSYRKREDT